MIYKVTKSSPVLVPPAASTPSCMLSLSSVDTSARINVDFISVFMHGKEPASRIKDAVSKALIHYYPVAGRIAWIKETLHEPVVDCTEEGIWFVEAVANCALADVKYLEVVPQIMPIKEFLPTPPAGVNLEKSDIHGPVGIWMNHMIFDGVGLAQFLKAVGEMAHGLPEPSIKPVWSRKDMPYPPATLSKEQKQSPVTFNFAMAVVNISLDCINRVKDLFFTKTTQTCSTFEIITALVFKSRVKAINLDLEDKVSLAYPASTRRLLHDIFPHVEGYYGNCLYGVEIVKTTEEINNASLIEVVRLVKVSKEVFGTEFMDWINGKLEGYAMQHEYGRLFISDWRRIGFNEVDYGWGKPKYIFPHREVVGADFYAFATVLNPPVPKQGVRLILRCLEEGQLTEFYSELEKIQVTNHDLEL